MKSNSYFFVLIVLCCLGLTVQIRSQDPKLIELRNQFALRYLQPDAHFALAKYYLDHRNYLEAFFIIEYARRYRFEEKDFDSTYVAFFGDPMPEPPDAAKTAFETASNLVTQQKYDEAEGYFKKANDIYDRSFFINAWIGRFYYKAKSDNSRALPFYFKAYFLYPHAYETEYAEYRIRAIAIPEAEISFNELRKSGKTLAELARDPNPLVTSMAVQEMAKNWKQEYVPALVEVISNDDSALRWGAFTILQKYMGASFDPMVDSFLSDKDLRKRGLAAYSIVERSGPERFRILEKMLSDDAELVRFEAISALALKGGAEGKQMLQKQALVEKQPRLKALINVALTQAPDKLL
jgi:FOG: HEAT repeat